MAITSLLVRISWISGFMAAMSLPAISGAAMMHHRLKCERYSVLLMPPLPTSSMSGSFQCPGPAKSARSTCMSAMFTTPAPFRSEERAVFGVPHAAVAHLEHVGVVPVPGAGEVRQIHLHVGDVHHARAIPGHLALPNVFDIGGGAPQMAHCGRPCPGEIGRASCRERVA